MVVRIFDRYLGKQVLSATLMGVLLLSGVMVLGNVYKKLDELLGDTQLPLGFILEFISLVIPFSLIFTIPWAFLTGILLVFGRLSADNELVSLRMTGWSMSRICASVFALAFALSAICYWVNVSVSPMAKDRIKRMFFAVALDNPSALFQEGRVLDKVPGFRIHTTKRDGNVLHGLEIVEVEGRLAKRIIHAERATLEMQPGVLDIIMHLEGAEIENITYTPERTVDKVEFVNAGKTAMLFPLSRLKEDTVKVNASMKSTGMLWQEISDGVDGATGKKMEEKDMSRSLTELSKRYSFSLACITFALVGIPLGVTAQRRETSTGFALSLVTATVYLVFIILADTLNDKPSAMPHLIMWAPNVLFMGMGGWLFYRLSRR
ncbi:lipopolysaccharide export system permease protein [Prosthecobacter debontii]|uniref:Lipopolysaccharide export system permease protein n=1 Tax=Prosthecobacter debontii TaxID=48467 RepID=A0A1T4XTU9_9BACT|nr:LptF/LptG family permease [Prosthecobacter debontii]SKA92823.1 lipopolysaccharide export system permease protein [Prosthecobacter debontii]